MKGNPGGLTLSVALAVKVEGLFSPIYVVLSFVNFLTNLTEV